MRSLLFRGKAMMGETEELDGILTYPDMTNNGT